MIKKYKWLLDFIEIADRKELDNPIWNTDKSIIDSAFGDLESEESLRELYVEVPNMHKLPAHLMGIGYDKFIALLNNEEAELKINHSKNKRLIFLYGSVGVGKSTYLRYVFNVTIKDAIKKINPLYENAIEPIGIFIDFKSATTNINNIENWVYYSIREQLKLVYKFDKVSDWDRMIKSELEHFRDIFPDNEEKILTKNNELLDEFAFNNSFYSKKVIKFLQTYKYKSIVIIFDNLDHHYDDEYIKKAICCAQAVSIEFGCAVVIALRQVNQGLATKSLFNDLNPFVLDFTNPDLGKTLTKRIQYAIRVALKNNRSSFNIENANHIAQEEKVIELFKNVAGSNIRLILQLIRLILSTVHIYDPDTKRIVLNYTRVIRALLYGSFKIFKPADRREGSYIVNIFENNEPSRSGNVLVRLRLLQLLETYKVEVNQEQLLEDMYVLGYGRDLTFQLINNFSGFKEKLIEAYHYTDDKNNKYVKLNISKLGRLHLKLVNELDYIDAIKSATFLPDELFEQIHSSKLLLLPNTKDQRKIEIITFISYLVEKEKEEDYLAKEHGNFFKYIELKKKLMTIQKDFLPKWEGQIAKIF